VVGAWVLLQVASLALQALDMPDALLLYFWSAAFLGLPVALLFGWYYEITVAGIRRTPDVASADSEALSPRIPDYLIIGALAIVVAVVAAGVFDRARYEGEFLIYDPKGIAVLPLDNLSGDDDQAYFSAGMHDALVTSLSQIHAFKVVSRRSTMRLDKAMSIPGIGQALGVRNIIEGSVLRDGNRVRIMVQLVDAARDVQIWAGSFERQLTGVLGLQNDIANSVAEAVAVQLSDEEESVLARQPEVNPQSYDAYLRGMYRIHDSSNIERRKGIAILKKAVERDPDSALLYAGLAYGYALLGHSPYPEGMYPASKIAAARALMLDDSLAEVYVAVGMQKMYYEWDFPAAENAFLRALEINPSLTIAHFQYAWLMELYLDSERSLPPGELTAKLDPLDSLFLGWLAEQYRYAGKYEEALAMADRALEVEPGHTFALRVKALTYADIGEFELALEASSQIADHPLWKFIHGVVLAKAGDEKAARDVLDSFEQEPRNVVPLIRLHAMLGDTEEVFAWLDVARDVKLPWYPWFITWFPDMDDYQDDPRMRAHARALGLEEVLDNVLARRE